MAKVLRIADIDQGTTVDLLAGTLKMQDGSWQTRRLADRAIETFKLVGDTTDASIITAENTLADILYEARRWHRDPVLGASYWLEAKADAETAKRTLIYDALLETETRGLNNPLLGAQGGEAFFNLALTRHPLWESVSSSTTSTTNVSSLGGKWSITPTGTADPRLAEVEIKGRSGVAEQTRFWMGIRPTYYGTTDFTTLWECESGTLGTDTSSTADAAASGGNVARTSFATDATLTDRVTLVIGNTTTPAHMVGRYLVLLRCYVSAGTIGAQMRTGFTSVDTFAEHREVFITNTGAQLVELGEIQIPGQGYRDLLQGANNVKNYTLKIAAERVSGAGTFSMDAIVLIPTEHFCYLDEVSVSFSGASWPTKVYVSENDEVATLSIGSASLIPTHSGIVNAANWMLPKDGGVLVLAGQGTTQVANAGVNMGATFFPRWQTFHA